MRQVDNQRIVTRAPLYLINGKNRLFVERDPVVLTREDMCN